MKAAVVSAFGRPPRYEDVADPVASGPDEVVVDVLAAGLHPRVRSQADGSHYTSTGALPLVPGVDGVGRDPDGRLRYFVLRGTTQGSMAERAVVDVRRSVVLPEDADPVVVAAAMNPAMSSWVALRRRTEFRVGGTVLVLGATGTAGRLAVQVARQLGADRIVAAGRDTARLALLPLAGATDTVALDEADTAGRLGAATSEVDVVLDYLWGAPTAAAMTAVVAGRTDRGRPLTWIEVGSVAGPTAAVPSAALRGTPLQITGSGEGSVSTREIVAELPALAQELTRGTLQADARPVPLAEVERAWTETPTATTRAVLVP